MFRGLSAHYKVVHKNDEEYAVWHAEAKVVTDWMETGRYGSVNECFDFIEAKEGKQGFLFKFDI